jgi:hypothetical protein
MNHRTRLLLAFAAFLISGGCGRSDPEDVLALQTSQGVRLSALAHESGERVILIVDPAEWFPCYNGLTGC